MDKNHEKWYTLCRALLTYEILPELSHDHTKPHSKKIWSCECMRIIERVKDIECYQHTSYNKYFLCRMIDQTSLLSFLISLTIHPHHTSISFYCQIIVIIKDIERNFPLHRIFNDKFPSHSFSPVARSNLSFSGIVYGKMKNVKKKIDFLSFMSWADFLCM